MTDPVERIAQAMHQTSDHDKDLPGPLAPDDGASVLCNCRTKARALWPTIQQLIDETRASMQQLQDRMSQHILNQSIEIKELRDKLTELEHHTGEPCESSD